jgi:UDP-N-acetylglucosamine 2-epimerase (non-hydrolysing)
VTPRRALIVFGTRPEAIKLAPVIHRLRRDERFDPLVVCSGQHLDLVEPLIDELNLEPCRRLGVMTPNQSLNGLLARLLDACDRVFAETEPDLIVVQGDTMTALAAALTSANRNIPVAHVEAGLRTGDRNAPFPEETNRRLIADLATWHFAPAERNRAALMAEGIDPATITVTGNTIVDALDLVLSRPSPVPRSTDRYGVVTVHRREAHGSPLGDILDAVAWIAERHPDLELILPVHPNPNVREPVFRRLGRVPTIRLIEPLPYSAFIHLLAGAKIALTDSGGIQEEAVTLGVPLIVMRETTERPEAVDAGLAELPGFDPGRILAAATRLLEWQSAPRNRSTLYGDGHAAEGIVEFLASRYG